ncbi:Yip1 family protein [Endozoicomonas sp. GU-1]|uniref:Yip1 family protein n=1 Tax=Endozoicomonas sp. GU-1 TaxID=3009078 RepID=UPI0022B2B945|nr:Yip1 family protein [Endozoicomonas sp. GU-1]WBA80315.1 Yip1 family protein [Endozoicomonas sp. GU-1]WBA87886.1 Yip1 family protein [Endozoicomonas sp. GU-1]
MILSHFWGLLTEPDNEWVSIRKNPLGLIQLYLGQIIWLAALPAICTYIGTTMAGWSLPGSTNVVRLTPESALWMSILAWLAMVCGVAVMSWFIHWMSGNFNSDPSLADCTAFTCYTAYPLFLIGICGLYPSLWLAIIAGTVAVSATAYLLYSGLHIFMKIPQEQGFIYASSVLCIGLVVLVAIMITTVIFWGMGIGPEYVQSY